MPCHTIFKLRNIIISLLTGLRYDLDFLVFRFDWGVALHDPYDTGKKGYYNIPKFKIKLVSYLVII